MELETIQNYLAASTNLDGVRSDVIKKELAAVESSKTGCCPRTATSTSCLTRQEVSQEGQEVKCATSELLRARRCPSGSAWTALD
jgi:hypothetical protein